MIVFILINIFEVFIRCDTALVIEMAIAINAAFVVPRFQSLTEVPVWEVLQSGADRNHGALGGREIHLNEHSGWIQVRVPKFPSIIQIKVKGLEPCSHFYETK